jgi:hypothetical protein
MPLTRFSFFANCRFQYSILRLQHKVDFPLDPVPSHESHVPVAAGGRFQDGAPPSRLAFGRRRRRHGDPGGGTFWTIMMPPSLRYEAKDWPLVPTLAATGGGRYAMGLPLASCSMIPPSLANVAGWPPKTMAVAGLGIGTALCSSSMIPPSLWKGVIMVEPPAECDRESNVARGGRAMSKRVCSFMGMVGGPGATQ